MADERAPARAGAGGRRWSRESCVDSNDVLAFANARARVLFSIHPKDIGRPLQDLEISYRPVELRSLIEQAYAERRAVDHDRRRAPLPGR